MSDAELIKQVGVIGIFAILIIRMLLDRLLPKQPAQPGPTCRWQQTDLTGVDRRLVELERLLDETNRAVVATMKLHEARDTNGVPRWYVKQSLEEHAAKAATAVPALERRLDEIKTATAHCAGCRELLRDIERTVRRGRHPTRS